MDECILGLFMCMSFSSVEGAVRVTRFAPE